MNQNDLFGYHLESFMNITEATQIHHDSQGDWLVKDIFAATEVVLKIIPQYAITTLNWFYVLQSWVLSQEVWVGDVVGRTTM